MNSNFYRDHGKRIMDVSLAALLLIATAPVLLVVALLVRIKLGSPVLFRHLRPGWRAAPFELLKFRTMTMQQDSRGQVLPDEERATPLGRLLRASSIDELPELWNVLRGEMSLVGPRPLMMHYLPRYSAHQLRRHDVRPGITGLAQVNGRNRLSWEKKFNLDVWYADHISLGLDLRILAKTLWIVVRREGISDEKHFSSPEFMGSDKSNLSGTK